jgi:uncharacterized membrane protein
MVSDTLANTTRAAHDLGLAAWLGGSMFGKFALNPSVAAVSSRAERGQVVNAAWGGYNVINTLALGAVGLGWLGARTTESGPWRLTDTEQSLAKAKDALVVGAVVAGAASGLQGARLAKAAPDGAVPVERGTEPAPETPSGAARIQRSLGVLGNLNVLIGVALVAVNAVMAQQEHSRPPLRRSLLRRSV